MNTKLSKLIKKFELLTFSYDYALVIFDQIREKFPNIKIHSMDKCREYVRNVSPYFIYKYIYSGNSLKACSAISFAFAEQGCIDGFAVLIKEIPGHYYNIMLTTEGPIAVDMSSIQFELQNLAKKFDYTDKDPYGEMRALKILLKEVKDNPFKTVKIWKTNDLDNVSLPSGKNTMDNIKSFDFNMYDKIIDMESPGYGNKRDFSEVDREYKYIKV